MTKCETNNKNLLFWLGITLIFSIIPSVLESACSNKEFECGDGSCIPKSWECDYEKDCNGGEDEGKQCGDCHNVGYICRETNKCIPNQWKCDNWTDCLLQDDERFCKECTSDEFKCNDGECISLDKLCDYKKDCYGGEDENTTLSTVEQSQLNAPSGAIPRQCDSCESQLNISTIICANNECVKGKKCDGIPDCIDNSDECKCGETNPFHNKCKYNETTTTTKLNTIKPYFTNDDDAPKWKYCPEGITWLAFLTYPTDNIAYQQDPKLKSMVKPNTTNVYWIEPKLRKFICNNNHDKCQDYKIIRDKKPGTNFSMGKHQVRYVGKKTDSDEDEAVTCVIDILVLGGMEQKQIDRCENSGLGNLIDWDFTVDKNYYVILDTGKLDGKAVDITTARYFIPDKSHLNCYASIVFEESIPIDNNILYTAIDWMVEHVWPIIGLVIGVLLLICGLCCGILCLWRKQAEYKAYEAADDFEQTDEDNDENDEDTDDDTGITSGKPIIMQSQISQQSIPNTPINNNTRHTPLSNSHRMSLSHSGHHPIIYHNPSLSHSINVSPNTQFVNIPQPQQQQQYYQQPIQVQMPINNNNIVVKEKRRRSILGMPVDENKLITREPKIEEEKIDINEEEPLNNNNNNIDNNDNNKDIDINNNENNDKNNDNIDKIKDSKQEIDNVSRVNSNEDDGDSKFLDNEWDSQQAL